MAALAYSASIYHSQQSYVVVKEDNMSFLKSFYRAGYELYSLLTIKNRLFHRALTEWGLSQEVRLRYQV